MIKTIRKRDGQLVEFNPTEANQWTEWASVVGVDWSGIVLEATRKCFDGCTTQDFHSALIAACVDRQTTAALKMAGRLYIGDMYKRAFGDWRAIPSVGTMYQKMSKAGLWANMDYTEEELAQCDQWINHELDLQATLTETKQICEKYAISDKVSKITYETPQFVYMRMALGNMEKQPKARRMEDVRKLYTYLSEKKINAPTPFMLNLGTNKKQYASCCVFTTDDTLPSLAAGSHIAEVMTGAQAGIGSHLKTRSKGDKVRGGAVVHQGKLGYYRVQEAVVAANTQAGRGGANTMHFNVLDPELEDLLRLKNPETVLSKRIKDIDYSVGYVPLFAKKAARNEQWMLISYADAPDLYYAMYDGDQTKFEAIYESYAAADWVPKKWVSAREIAVQFLTEAVETGRMYEHNTAEMNRHTPFKDTIHSSNLCQEIGLPTSGYKTVADLYARSHQELSMVEGEIGLCNLGAIAAGLVKEAEYEDVAYYTALMIDNVIEIMEYPFPHLAYTAKARRSIGVGITNLAYSMASQGLKYSSLEGKQYIHRLAEMHSFWLHKASVRLAREKGPCAWWRETKYGDETPWLPIDTANREIDKVVTQALLCAWEPLRADIKEHGVRFSVNEAHMPCESSSVAGGHTNSLYPVRALKVVKTSGTTKNLFIVPEYDTLGGQYELAWDIPTMDIIHVYAVVQKFTGQAISADTYIKYNNGKREISAKQLLLEWLERVKMGVKTRYYMNSATGVDEEQPESDASCEACKL